MLSLASQTQTRKVSLPLLKKGFTLVEILIVVIIVGLMAGIAIVKLADSRERAEENYLKSTIAFLDKGIQEVAIKEGSFPTIPDGSPESRIVFIMSEFQSRNMVVYLEATYGDEWKKVNSNYIQPLLASQEDNSGMISSIVKIRGSIASGNPEAKEILVLPRGAIEYPTTPTFVVNDPAAPDYTYHYNSFYLPQEVNTGIQNLLNGGFASDAERNLVIANIGLANADEELLKGLLLNTDNKEQASLAAMQLVNTINGSLEGAEMSPETAQRLLDQMLSNENYDPNGVDLSTIDISEFNPLSLNRVAQNASLTADQVGDLLSLNNAGLKNDLLYNTFLSDDAYNAVLDTVLTSENLSNTKFNELYYPILSNAPENLGKFITRLAEVITPGKAVQTLSSIGNLMNSSAVPADKKAELIEAVHSALALQYPTISPGDTVAQQAYSTALQFSASYGNESNEVLADMAVKLLSSAGTGSQFNPYTITNAITSGKLTVTPELATLALNKLTSGSTNLATIISNGAEHLSGTQITQLQDWIGTDPTKITSNMNLISNPLIYNTPTSLQGVVTAALNNTSASLALTRALTNPNLAESSKDAIFNYILANPNSNAFNYISGDSTAISSFSDSQKAHIIDNGLAFALGDNYNNYTRGLESLIKADALSSEQRLTLLTALANDENAPMNGYVPYPVTQMLNGNSQIGSKGLVLTESELSILANSPVASTYAGSLAQYLTADDSKGAILSSEGKQALFNQIKDSTYSWGDPNYNAIAALIPNYANVDPNIKPLLNDYIVNNLESLNNYEFSYGVGNEQLADMSSAQKEAIFNRYNTTDNSGFYNGEYGYAVNSLAYDQSWMTDVQFESFATNYADAIASGNLSLNRTGTITEAAAETLYNAIIPTIQSNYYGNNYDLNAKLTLLAATEYATNNASSLANLTVTEDQPNEVKEMMLKSLTTSANAAAYLPSLKTSVENNSNPDTIDSLLNTSFQVFNEYNPNLGRTLISNPIGAEYLMTLYRKADTMGVNWTGYVSPNTWSRAAFDSLSLDDKEWLYSKTNLSPIY